MKTRLDPRSQAAIALATPLAAYAAGAIGAAIAEASSWSSVDVRYVALAFPAALVLVTSRVLRPGSPRWARAAHGVLALPIFLAPFFPRSSLIVAWLSGGVLSLLLGASVHAARCAWHIDDRLVPRALICALTFALGIYYFAAAFVVMANMQLIAAPVRLAHQTPVLHEGERELTITTIDGLRLGATYSPGAPGAPGIVLAHGVSDGRSRFAPLADRLRERGYHVLRFDFRAHGTSEGAVCSYGQLEQRDVRAAIDALRALPGIDRTRIAVIGTSMGGGSVLAAAPDLPERSVRALVLLAPASSYPPLVERRVAWIGPLAPAVLTMSSHIARAIGLTPMTAWSPVDRLRGAPELPVLVLHGDADGTIPLALSRDLVREHPRAELVVLPRVEHDEIPVVAAEDRRAWAPLVGFLDRELGVAR